MKRERFFGLNLPGLAGFAIAVGVLVLVLSPVSSAGPTASDVSAQGVFPQTSDMSGLIAKAAEGGQVGVIVGLRPATEFIPEGTLASVSAIDQQRSEIATTRQALLGSLAGYNAQAYASWDSVPYVALKVDAEALRQLVASPYVTTIQEDIPDQPALVSVTAHIGADVTWAAGFGGLGKTVVIVDTGIDADHPFYGGRVVTEACWSNAGGGGVTLCPNGANSQTGAGSADALTAQCLNGAVNLCSHGSHVAGIAAGRDPGGVGYNGIAPQANIIVIQVFTRFNDAAHCAPDPAPCVSAYVSDQISALNYVNNTLRTNWDIAAANISLGGGMNTSACDGDSRKASIDNLLSSGIATVIASGNDGWTDALNAPGCISTAVTVGAVQDPTDAVIFNMHQVVDLLAVGDNVNSSVPDDAYSGNWRGTSMAAPQVTGAFAMISAIDPSMSVNDVLDLLKATGVLVTDQRPPNPAGAYVGHVKPRIQLDAAVASLTENQPPVADANGPYVTSEGANVTLNGTGSSDPDGDPLTYQWDLDNDGSFDDATGPTPVFDMVGQDGVYTVRLRVCDLEPLCAEAEATVTVNNVAPSVSLGSDAPKDEGSAVTVNGVVTDPGWLDPLSGAVDWGDGTPPEPVGGVMENVRPDATLTFSVSHVYGDNGVFTAQVCASDDDTTTCGSIALQIDNVDPTAEIDESGAVLVNGVPTFIAHIGDSLDFSGHSTDPGSDDLLLTWDWGNGSPTVSTMYLVNPPNPDPFPSPSIQPRDVTDTQAHTYANACLYQVRFWAEDDDGGVSPVDTANVVIVGNADQVRTAGYWADQFRSQLTGKGRSAFDRATLQCYLAITGYMSQVFDEETDASTFELAHGVLRVNQDNGDMSKIFDRQLLAVWLNFANGSIEYDEPLGIDPVGITLTDFLHVVASIEGVRLDPAATPAQLEGLKNVLEGINKMGR